MGARPGKRKPRSPGAHGALSRALPSIGCWLSPPSAGCRSHSKALCLTGNPMALWLPVPTGEHGSLPHAHGLGPLIWGLRPLWHVPGGGWGRRGSSGRLANACTHPGPSLGAVGWIINDEAGVQSQTHAAAAVPGRSQLSILG